VRKHIHFRGIERSRLTYLLAAAVIAAVVVAYTSVGAISSQTAMTLRTATAQSGVVQSTVSGSGKVEPASELDLGFKTSGTVTHIYVVQGQHVTRGQLLAELNPKSAEVTLDQARATLRSAEANLAEEEESEGETSSSLGSSSPSAATATASSTSTVSRATYATATTPTQTSTQPATSTTGAGSPTTRTGISTTETTTTTPAATTTPTTPTSPRSNPKSGSSTSPQTGGGQGAGSGAKQSAATREANLISAEAAVKSDRLAVENDEQAVQDTKLYAPETGTIVSLPGEVGETVSATGTMKASSSESSSATGSGSAGGGAGAGRGASAAGTGSASSSSGSSTSAFAVLSQLDSMQLIVGLSESEIGSVKVGQTATVAVEALNGAKVAAHVIDISMLPSSSTSSSVVSYDVTFELDQLESGLKPGMSATAEVVIKQAEGVNVPTSAISGASVTVVRAGKQVRRTVVTGLAGNSSTLIVSGLKAGEEVLLPQASTSTTGASGSSRLGSRAGGGTLGGGGLGRGGFPGGVFLGGGPPGG
jgi:multidrug efflux pump subunit AcrA (membrane-fusion protein)